MTLLADLVSASKDVAGTSSRSRKVAILAELLGRLDRSEVPVAVGFLSGAPRQTYGQGLDWADTRAIVDRALPK